MAFTSIEEANKYQMEMEKKYSELETAHEGLKTKLTDIEKNNDDSTKEIERLKAKNFELYELVSISNKNTNNDNEEDNTKNESSLDDVINDFIK